MAVIKNEIPILEYDTEAQAVLMPGEQWSNKFTDKVVMLFMDLEIQDYVASHKCEEVGEFVTVTKSFKVYKTVHKGEEITFCQTPLGGAAAVQVMEQLIKGGAKKIIAAGCCGALVDDTEGDYFIPVAALRQEGTSYHYLPPAREVMLSKEAIDGIEKALINNNCKYRKCKTWTTDGFYRETKDMVLYRKEEGYSVVEMECASMAACAKMRNIIFGQLLFTADSLANVDAHDERNWGEEHFAYAMMLAFDAVLEV